MSLSEIKLLVDRIEIAKWMSAMLPCWSSAGDENHDRGREEDFLTGRTSQTELKRAWKFSSARRRVGQRCSSRRTVSSRGGSQDVRHGAIARAADSEPIEVRQEGVVSESGLAVKELKRLVATSDDHHLADLPFEGPSSRRKVEPEVQELTATTRDRPRKMERLEGPKSVPEESRLSRLDCAFWTRKDGVEAGPEVLFGQRKGSSVAKNIGSAR
ncbi:UNVERIFIED_CONTAM: hypothetical protein PYX00_009446 [Menopon gallinae]|uniref:Uncharacterized protein n=1 Tax=Menopon gallinae TaxID=328185 RepID=A0AAW2HB31_9NEOP